MDDELRRRARAARAEIEAQVEVDAELDERPTRPMSGIAPVTPLPPRGRIVAVAGSIAAVAVAIVGGIVLVRGPDSIETSDPSTPIATTSDTSPAVTSTTTDPVPTTTVVPTASSDATTSTAPASQAGEAAVSYLDPPPTVALTPLGVVSVPEPTAGMYQVAIGDLGVAVSSRTYQPTTARLDIIGWDGTTRTYDDDTYDNVIAYGPGDVVYTTAGEPMGDFAVAAIPVSGDRSGEIIASEPANWMRYIEYPPSSFGHGPEGVAMRRDAGQVAIGYVDIDGKPTTLDDGPTFYEVEDELGDSVARGTGVVTSSAGDTWILSIDPHPEPASTFVTASPAAPTNDGNGVYWTHIGPDLAPEIDFGEPSQWVVAQLRPGGSATWWSLPDGWTIAASDIWGTVAVRQQGEQLEVALVDFTPDEQPPPTTTSTTTTTTTVAPGVIPPPEDVDRTCRIDTDDIDDPDVQELVADLIADRRAGEFVRSSDCLDAIPADFAGAVPRCWSPCAGWEQRFADREITVFDVETPACCVGRSFSLYVSYRHEEQFVDVTEIWTLEVADDGLQVESVDFIEPVYTREEAVETLTTYLGHVRDEAWVDAALMLDDGAINADERSDLAQLDLDDYAVESIADALEAWCADGCETDVPTPSALTWDGIYGIGTAPQRVRVAWYEGTRSIFGLPIQAT